MHQLEDYEYTYFAPSILKTVYSLMFILFSTGSRVQILTVAVRSQQLQLQGF